MAERNIAAIYPLSPMQQGMLAHTLADSASGAYFEQLSCVIRGDLCVPAFQQAWQSVVDRHDILRTFFVWEDLAAPVQIVRKHVILPWQIHDWSGLAADAQQAQLAALLQADRARRFTLAKAPLMRLALIRLASQTYQIVWSYHHILLDGWCQPLLLGEVMACYEAARRGAQAPLPPARPYRDYIAWLERQPSGEAEPFWRAALRGVRAPTPLTVDRSPQDAAPAPDAPTQVQAALPQAATAALQALAQHHRLTLNTLVQGAWALLLHRYSGEADVVFGVTVAGRPAALADVERMVGLFINTLPLRVPVPRRGGLLAWLQQLQDRQAALHQYEYCPLAQIHDWSEVPRALPLFESIVVFQHRHAPALPARTSGLEIAQVRSAAQTPYPLTLVAVAGQQLSLNLHYDPARFTQRMATRMLGHLQTLLAGIAQALTDGQTAASPSSLVLLTDAEQRQALHTWNATAVDRAAATALHHLCEHQAAQTPDAVAASFDEQQLSYAALNARANQLAHHLRAHGVGPDTRVAVCIERSLDLIVALLAVLKAGGAYLPLDPAYPSERVAFMLRDARPALLLTHRHTQGRLPAHSVPTLDLSADWPALAGLPTTNPDVDILPAHLAYVIYTSGSTGTPKGAMNTHQAIINRLVWMQAAYGLTPDDVVLQKTSFSFDVSVWEFFWPLIVGARLVFARPEGHKDSAYLVDLIATAQVTTLHFVPSMLALFLEEPDLSPCRPLRRVICSGEALSVEVQNRCLARLEAALHNLYGPTEAAVDVSAWPCQRDSQLRSVPIGWPIDNTQLYVLDPQMRLVPVGVPGELYIGGVQLARGYLDRPDLTAERFVPNPYGAGPCAGTRLYKTGDQARYREDGSIDFLGRLDEQVKLRGFRIELGEIRSALEQHPAVARGTVVVYEDQPGQQQLVAYVVPRHKSVDAQAIRAFLAARLPAYMVPAAYVAVGTLPINANGKLDRRALPPPGRDAYISASASTPPRTSLEQSIAAIWADLLGVQDIGVDDDFFALGGHSLLATQLILRLRDKLQIDLALPVLYRSPTVAGIAESVAAAPPPAAPHAPVPSLDLRAEATLDPSIGDARCGPLEASQLTAPRSVLLTGATGFLGAYLLHELLTTTDATVYCLVRAAHPQDALTRIKRTLVTYRLWDAALRPRIIPVAGDLAQPLLGLAPAAFDRLADEIDAVYHNGALVNFIYSYQALRAANALGTQEILRLATQRRLKPVHYISTLGVFSQLDAQRHQQLTEDVAPECWEGLSGGYSQSKWVAERLVAAAQARGVPTTIHRVGSVSGHSTTGAYQTGDFFCQMLKASLEIGSIAEGFLRAELRLTPVDFVSRAIVYLARQPESVGRAFHLFNTRAIAAPTMLESLSAFPIPVRIIDDHAWRAEMIAAATRAPDSMAARLVPFLPPDPPPDDAGGTPGVSSGSSFGCPRTLHALAGAGIVCPAPTAELMRTYLQYFIDTGFIALPHTAATA